MLSRLILLNFGSETNGLISSISQFLQIITFLELGIGAVVSSALYKPLSIKDEIKTSQIIVSANKFFRKIGNIMILYVFALVFVYPNIINQKYDFLYTSLLIVSISISNFSQYYFGIVDGLLLNSDQHGYINYNIQIVTLIANAITSVILIKMGKSIQFIKLTSSIIYLVRPLIQRIYINNHYHIDRKITYKKEPIVQKWNGIAQHFSAVVLSGTDNIVLSIFSTLSNVSIYSVYFLVIVGIKNLLISMTNGITAYLGFLLAKSKFEELKKTFEWFEWIMHTLTVLIFGCTGMLILPFIQVYTKGIYDVNYYQPVFAILLTMANAGHCLRIPYNAIILSAGHYKQTQKCYIIAAIINLVISIITVKIWGLVGVAIGTFISMFYQTIWMALYDSKNIIKWPIKNFVKQLIIDIFSVLIGGLITSRFKIVSIGYIDWLFLAIKTFSAWFIIILLINLIFYKPRILLLYYKIKEYIVHFIDIINKKV